VSEEPAKRRYVEAVLETYIGLPGTPKRSSRRDRRLAATLYEKRRPLKTVRSALLLAAARRALRSAEAPILAPIRTLFYFLPVIEELLEVPQDTSYLRYLETKLQTLIEEKRRSLSG
jgi:hypothetical protein